MRYEILAGKATIESVEAFLHDIDAIARSNNATIQAVDASKVADMQHVEDAVRQALRSFADGRNIATNPGVEILLHLSACRQIQKALNLGLQKGEMDVLFVIVGTRKAIEMSAQQLNQLMVVDPRVIDYREAKRETLMQTFNITEEEVRAVGGSHRIPELVRERLTLFNAYK
ncbi:MAG: KEOPS complex subunit Cgi121 [Halobacteriota archaeon]|jgi:KEOPS complex subunit Cgi121|nr:KEOPS complex subunit Cgi121 [Euryarchaeota archaeon]